MNQSAYRNPSIFTGEKWLENQAVLVKGETIIDIVSTGKIPDDFEMIDCQGKILAPAFIDLQIYGAGGKLFSAYPTTEALRLLAAHNLENGTANC